MELFSSPVFTGGAGVVLAAVITGVFAWFNSRRARKVQERSDKAVADAREDERVEARAREQRGWERQQASLKEQRESDWALFESQQEAQRTQLELQQAAKSREEVRSRTVHHLEAILFGLRRLEDYLEEARPETDKLDEHQAEAVRLILKDTAVETGYCGPEVREYVGVLINYETAFKEYGSPDRLKQSERAVLKNLVVAARELVYADIRGEEELLPDAYLEWIQSYIRAFEVWEEYEFTRLIEEAERSGDI